MHTCHRRRKRVLYYLSLPLSNPPRTFALYVLAALAALTYNPQPRSPRCLRPASDRTRVAPGAAASPHSPALTHCVMSAPAYSMPPHPANRQPRTMTYLRHTLGNVLVLLWPRLHRYSLKPQRCPPGTIAKLTTPNAVRQIHQPPIPSSYARTRNSKCRLPHSQPKPTGATQCKATITPPGKQCSLG